MRGVAGTYVGEFTSRDSDELDGDYPATLVLEDGGEGRLDVERDFYDGQVVVGSVTEDAVEIRFLDSELDWIIATLERDGDRLSGPWAYEAGFVENGMLSVTRERPGRD